MTQSRAEQVNEEATQYYHCVTRCVRRAFLCGEDAYSGKNFDHRREWILERLGLLSTVFAIDILAFAVMVNHLHLALRLASERAQAWSDDEVVRRYGVLFPVAKAQLGGLVGAERAARVEVWRSRLSSLSWMMRSLNEWVARKANKEDGCRGRFWEGRFKSQPVLDEAGLLACMAYVDLNPVRSGECDRLEDARWTSIGRRLQVASDDRSVVPEGLAPFADQLAGPVGASETVDSAGDPAAVETAAGAPAPIPMTLAEYIELLEWTGRCHRATGPSGVLRGAPPAILGTLGVDASGWLKAMTPHGLASRGALGRVEALCAHAERAGRRRVTGRSAAAALFH